MKKMKRIDDYMNLPYKMEIVADVAEGGFAASFPELPGCVTCGETVEQAVKDALDAKRAWLEAAMESGVEIPEPSASMHYSGQFKLRIPKTLHRLLSETAKEEGISLNQYCVYLLSKEFSVELASKKPAS